MESVVVDVMMEVVIVMITTMKDIAIVMRTTTMMTAVAVGLCSSLEEAKKIFVSEKKQYVPSCENAKIYQKKYDAYKKIYDAVRPIIDEASIKQS